MLQRSVLQRTHNFFHPDFRKSEMRQGVTLSHSDGPLNPDLSMPLRQMTTVRRRTSA